MPSGTVADIIIYTYIIRSTNNISIYIYIYRYSLLAIPYALKRIDKKSISTIFLLFDFSCQSVSYINYIALAIDPFLGLRYCLSAAYRLPLMRICSAIMDMGLGAGPGQRKDASGRTAPFGPGPGPGPGPIIL